MIKLGQVYLNPLTGLERTVISFDRQEDRIILKRYDERYGTVYTRWTFKQLKERCILKEEIK